MTLEHVAGYLIVIEFDDDYGQDEVVAVPVYAVEEEALLEAGKLYYLASGLAAELL